MAHATAASIPSAKRAELLGVAGQLFYRDGYRAVGIDTLLAESGIAKKTLYHHFASKDALIVTVLEERSHALLAAMDRAMAEAGRSPARQLSAVFAQLEAWFATDEFKGCAFIRALSEYPDPQHPIHQAAWKHKTAVRARLAMIGAAAAVKSPRVFADTIGIIIDGAIVTAHATGEVRTAETARKAALELLKLAA